MFLNNEFNFFKQNAINKITNDGNNLFLLAILFYLFTIPLPLLFNNIAFSIVLLFFLIRKKRFIYNLNLFVLIFVFLWIAASYFWSVDKLKTLNSIPREIHFLLIPLGFLYNSDFLKNRYQTIIKYFSYFQVFLALFFITRAIVRYYLLGNVDVFFFHGEYSSDFGLVPKELNAIHISVFVGLSYFYFLTKIKREKYDNLIVIFLLAFIVLLSSSNIIFITLLLSLVYYFYFSKQANRMRLRNSIIFLTIASAFFYFEKVSEFMRSEIKSYKNKGLAHNVIEKIPEVNNRVTIYEAWNKQAFSPDDFFPGMAFRVYQTRIFFEFLEQDSIFWKGFGFNASQPKIEKKGIEYNLFMGNKNIEGYQKKNFHNQYIQTFAELGIVGFLLFVLLLFFSLKTAIKNKDFMHIAFTILMISVFLTESFLWRQRGVVFFTFFYCLFIVQKTKNK